jgi:hypothetical protein
MEFEWYQAESNKRDFRLVGIPNESLSLIHNQPCKQRGQLNSFPRHLCIVHRAQTRLFPKVPKVEAGCLIQILNGLVCNQRLLTDFDQKVEKKRHNGQWSGKTASSEMLEKSAPRQSVNKSESSRKQSPRPKVRRCERRTIRRRRLDSGKSRSQTNGKPLVGENDRGISVRGIRRLTEPQFRPKMNCNFDFHLYTICAYFLDEIAISHDCPILSNPMQIRF